MSQEVLPSAAETFYVVAGVDYGTQSDVIKVQLFDGEKSFGPPFFIQECLGLYAIPAQAAYHEGALYTGWELDDHIRGLKEPTIPSDKVIQFAKLALYEHSKGSPMTSCVKRVEEQLAWHGKNLDEFLADHLAALINKGRNFLVEHPSLSFSEDRIRNMPWHVRLTVPHSWSPSACTRMQNAARNAGIKITSLASEPECAVASSIDLLCGQKVQMPRPLVEQSRILCADLGCGTADYTLVELADALAINSKLRVLKETGDPLGGSQGINERLLATYEKSLGDEDAVREKAESLGFGLASFRYLILDYIERHKMDFPGRGFYPIVLLHPDGRMEQYAFSESVSPLCKYIDETRS